MALTEEESKRLFDKANKVISDVSTGYSYDLKIVLSVLEGMSSEQRVRMFVDIFDEYCRYCGDHQPQESICQCNNDE